MERLNLSLGSVDMLSLRCC